MKRISNNLFFLTTVIACGILYLYLNSELFFENVFERKFTLNYPVYAVQDSDGNRYVIDNSFRRISKINKEEEMVYRIHGGSRAETHFFYANDIEVDNDGYLYVLNYVADQKGFYLNREEILRFSPTGEYDGRVYHKMFGQEDKKAQLIQRGEVFSLEVQDNLLSWFTLTGDGITKYSYDIKRNELQEGNNYPLAEANIVVSDIIQLSTDSFVYSSKDGLITRVLPNGSTHILFSADKAQAKNGSFIVPWEIGADASENIYFVDLEGKNIRSILSPANTRILLDQAMIEFQLQIQMEAFNYYRLSVNADGTLVTCNDKAVVTRTPNGTIHYFTSANLPLVWQLKVFTFWGICLILGFLIIWKFRLIYVSVLKRKVPNLLTLSIGITVIVATVALLSSYYFITNFSQRYQNVVFEKLSQIIQLVPKVLDGNRIEKIAKQSDFNNADYKYVYNTLYNALNRNQDDWNDGYYFALYRVMNERLYGMMYIDGRINMYYPFDWLGDGGVYDQALAGHIATEAVTDITGDWIYGVGPVTNSAGKVVAILEIGTDLYYLRLENQRLIKELVLNLLIVLIIFVLVLVEILYVGELHKKKHLQEKHQKKFEEQQPFSEIMLIRPLSFLYFTSVSVSITFVPLLMKQFYEPIPGLSQEMVLAMPLSLEMFGFGVGTTIAGGVASRIGWKWAFYLGLFGTAIGLLLSGLADSMLSFNIARSMTGMSSGFTLIAMRSFINQESRTIERSQGFSQFYSGMTAGICAGAVFGGTLANHISFSNIFFIALSPLLLTVIFQLFYLKNPSFSQKAAKIPKRESISLLESLKIFIMSGKNLVFLTMIVFPTYIAGTFAGYYFPLFAESQGLSTAGTGLFIISGGLLVIYLGPILSNYLERQWGTYKSMIFGSILWGISLIVFALTGNLIGAIVTLVLMGITEGFCVTAQNEFFLKLPPVAQLGEDRAVSYFEFFSSVAETIGPLTFAMVFISGTMGFMFLGLGIIILTLLFILFMNLTQNSILEESVRSTEEI